MALNYLVGDATEPQVPGPKMIAHVVNDVGAWGAGFTASINSKWPEVGRDYRNWFNMKDRGWGAEKFKLGAVRYVIAENIERGERELTDGILIAHMVAQQGLPRRDYRRPLRYDALGACLMEVGRAAAEDGYTVHMPRIGSGLAGGDWMYIEKILADAMGDCEAYIYSLPL